MPERPGQAGAHQQFGEQREQDGRQHDPAEHQRDGERAQPRRLLGEGEVAVADGGDRLHGEVQGVEHGHVRAVGFDVPEPQHDDRQHGQAQQRQQCRAQRAVGLGDERAQQRAHAGSPAVLLQLDGAGRTGRAGTGGVPGPLVRLGRNVGDVPGRELRGRADGGHPVSGPDGGVATRAHERRRPVPGHRDRRQLAVELAQRRGPVDDQLRGEEGLPGQHHPAGPGAPAGLDDCGYREGGDVEDAVLPGGLGQRAAHRRVAHADDQPHVRPDPPDEQGGLQAPQVVVGDADHCGGGVEPRGLECLARAAGHLRHAPAREEGVGDGIGVVGPGGDHDGVDAGGVQVLDGAQPDAAHAVDDHVPGGCGVVASGGGAVRSRGDPVDGGHAGIVLDRCRCTESGFRYIHRTESHSYFRPPRHLTRSDAGRQCSAGAGSSVVREVVEREVQQHREDRRRADPGLEDRRQPRRECGCRPRAR